MSFDLVDKDGGEIRATAWNDQVDQYQDIIQVRKDRSVFASNKGPRLKRQCSQL